jgi:ABC-2 type transport system ATP-binding protein
MVRDMAVLLAVIVAFALLYLLALVIGSAVRWLHFREVRRQNEEMGRQNRELLDLQRRNQVTERFSRAVAQLAEDRPDIRIAAIYTLEQIAYDMPEMHWTIVEILAAFLRDPARAAERTGEARRPRPDVQAAVAMIRRRNHWRDPEGCFVDLSGAELAHADLTGAQLAGATLDGAHLEGASFRHANLEAATFYGAHLEGATFERAHLERSGFARLGVNGNGAVPAASGLSWQQMSRAVGVDQAVLPAYLRPALDGVEELEGGDAEPSRSTSMALVPSAGVVIATDGLSKSYGKRRAVVSLDLEVREREVFGFLGPNGAGKTTTIRMLLGLIRPSAGHVEVFGQELASAGGALLPRMGALIEAPAFYGYLSGRGNLRAFGWALGGVSDRRLDEVLELVGLRDRQRDRVRSYSLGMKQRLGVATALLHDPELLILDEPANGLDPAGIVEMRDLLRNLAAAGKTVFVSSHVLPEVQQSCDRVAIIDRGRLVNVAPVAELVRSSGTFEVQVDDAAAALDLIRRQGWGAGAHMEDGILVTSSPTGRGRELLDFLVEAGFHPDAVVERRRTLESIFLELTGTPAGVT